MQVESDIQEVYNVLISICSDAKANILLKSFTKLFLYALSFNAGARNNGEAIVSV